MLNLDEPNGKYGRWGQAGSALLTFAILGFVIVVAVLDWLVGAPTWVLLVACIPIAVFSVAWGFTVVDDDEDEETREQEDDSEMEFKFVKPSGVSGWLRKIGSTLAGVLGVFFAIGIPFQLAGLPVREWSNLAQFIVFWAVIIFAVIMEFTTFGEDEEDRSHDLPAVAPASGNANARFHQRDHQA